MKYVSECTIPHHAAHGDMDSATEGMDYDSSAELGEHLENQMTSEMDGDTNNGTAKPKKVHIVSLLIGAFVFVCLC
jgi:hypothetical protein